MVYVVSKEACITVSHLHALQPYGLGAVQRCMHEDNHLFTFSWALPLLMCSQNCTVMTLLL